jgi:site-specific recombinase XerD
MNEPQAIAVYTGAALAAREPTGSGLALAIAGWLAAKQGLSGSERTRRAYEDELRGFRALLTSKGYDLDAPPDMLTYAVQAWCGRPARGGEPTASTHNQRRAILSSFYGYAIKHGAATFNPCERVEQRKVQAYASARPLPAAEVKQQLAKIDRSTLDGARDYALLAVAYTTGRRVSELAALSMGDVLIDADNIILIWRHCKGGKVMRDKLAPAVAAALRHWLALRPALTLDPAAPVWVSLARRFAAEDEPRRLTAQAIADVCARRLGESKVHALRHTYAHQLERNGAAVSFIQSKLGHSSLSTTSKYLQMLASEENPYAAAVAAAAGIS